MSLSKDGEAWTDIEYTVSGGEATPYWVSATSDFTLAGPWISSLHPLPGRDELGLPSGRHEAGDGPRRSDREFSAVAAAATSVAITIPEIIAKMTAEQTVLDASADRTFEAVIVTDKQGR